jgi:hypothetical protein
VSDVEPGGVEPGDFDLGGVEEANERGIRGGDPVMGDAVNRVGEEPEPAIDPWIAENQAEPIRITDRGPGGGTPPGTPATGDG